MGIIDLTKEEFLKLKRPVFLNGEFPIGGEGSISLYNKENEQTSALKIFHGWNIKNKKNISKMNSRQENVSYFSMMNDIDVLVLARDIVLVESLFAGFGMRYFDDPYSLYSEYFFKGKDLSFAVKNAKRLHDGIRYEAHEREIYANDLTPGNIIFFNNKAFLIDTNGYIIKALEPKLFNEEKAIKEDIIRIIQILITLITRRYSQQIVTMDIINRINFSKELSQYFQLFFDDKEPKRYIDNDIFKEIESNYIIIPNEDKKLVGVKYVLTKK